ncbi:MAG: SAVED domain-containing protein [Anaerolineae bacterium]|nr:SAVED domain-containing protein [Anaerolineae bacterium]
MIDLTVILQQAKTVGDALDAVKTAIEIVILSKPFVTGVIGKAKGAATALIGRKEDTLKDKADVAILIQATNRPAHIDAKGFLDATGIDTPLFVVGMEDDPLKGGDIPNQDRQAWRDLAHAFVDQVHGIQQVYGRKQYHVFVNAPGVLAFAIGSTVGTLYPIRLYNLNRQSTGPRDAYIPVLDIPEDVR